MEKISIVTKELKILRFQKILNHITDIFNTVEKLKKKSKITPKISNKPNKYTKEQHLSH